MIETALKYYYCGLSVIPIDDKKVPIGKWKHKQAELLKPNGEFTGIDRIGIVTGRVSGGLEVIDIDTKYDITGTLFNDYKKLINSVDNQLLKKLVVQQTQSGGYHFIYRCKAIEGNQKLAKRPPTPDELIANPKEKSKAIIETRGEGGYIACFPTASYKLIYGNFDVIHEISEDERQIILDCAKSFNQSVKPLYEKPQAKKAYQDNLSPFEDWNERGDVLGLLEQEGWIVTLKRGSKNLLLRPSGEGKWSADWDEEKRLFYVWTSSTDFENETAYNSSQVLTILKFNGDYSACAKWLLENGYGESKKNEKPKIETVKSIIRLDDNNFDFLATQAETDSYIEKIRNGTFEMGKTTGFPVLDNHWRFKVANLVTILGHDNIGKSVAMWYFAMLSAHLHDWNWVIFSAENKTGGVKKKIIEFYTCKAITDLSDAEYKRANEWFLEHFDIIRNNELYNYSDMLNMGRKLNRLKRRNAFLIDPYNSLDKPTQNEHQYDYRATSEMRVFIEQEQCGIYLNIHAVTEALRRVYWKGHIYEGHPMPPNKSEGEGGGKFANKTDDFLVFHRMTQHPTEWMNMEIHVKKIKETETGGRTTTIDAPIKLRMIHGGVGYEDMNGFNPMKQEIKAVQEYAASIKNIQTFIKDNKEISHADSRIEPNRKNEPQLEDFDDGF